MTRSKKQSAKLENTHAANWLDQLTLPQARALGCQYRVEDAYIKDIEQLRTALLLIPEVRQLAGDPEP